MATVKGLLLEAFDSKGKKVRAGYKVAFIGELAFGVINEYSTEKDYLELRPMQLQAENERLKKVIEAAISQHHRVRPNTVVDILIREYEVLKGKDD